MNTGIQILARGRLALATAVLAMAPLCSMAVEVGQPAPDVALAMAAKTVRLADYKGKVVYLDFWASWCGPCKQSFPWLNELQAKYGPDGFVVIGINVDKKREDATRFLDEVPAKFTVAYDEQGLAPRAYAVKVMPSSVLIGPDGVIRVVHRGFRADETAALEAKIRAALGK